MPSAPYGSSPAANVLNPSQPAAVNPQTPLIPPSFSDPGTMPSQTLQSAATGGTGSPFTPRGGNSGGGGNSSDMMRRMFGRGLFGLLLLLLAPALWATTTVTGTIQNLGTGAVGSNAFVRFWLRGCGGNIPRVNGTAVIGPSQGGVYFFDFAASGSGTISGTLYSTRDSTGLLGGDVECGGVKTSVWYGMQVFVGGKGGAEVPVHAKNTATLDVSNVTPISTNPTVTAPAGDSTYLRLDGGNNPLTSLTVSGTTTLAGTTLIAAGPICDVKAYGALGDFSHDDTAAIVAAYTACATVGGITYFPRGTYRAVPATVMAAPGGNVTVAFPMQSNMHLWGEQGATIKLANAQSTDVSPKDLELFFTNTALTNISFHGLIMDMNYPSNTISPGRPGTYNAFNFAMIYAGGDNGRVDDMLIEYCQFLNTPGQNEIIAGVSNTPGITLGKRWTVVHNTFKDNGMDTNDNTAVYGWVDTMTVHDNIFEQTALYGAVGHTGAFSAFEVHGINHTVHDNLIRNYFQGGFVSNNYTSLVYNTDVHDNNMVVTFAGVQVVNTGTNSAGLQDVKIHDNAITFVEQTYSGSPGSQSAFTLTPDHGTTANVDITDNHVNKQGTNTVPALLCNVLTLTGTTVNDIRVNNNTAFGLANGIVFRTDFGGTIGFAEASGNKFTALKQIAGTGSAGVTAVATNGIKTLRIDGNSFIDEQGSPTFQKGIVLTGPGTISDLYVGPQTYKGLTSFNYGEVSAPTITNRRGTTFPGGEPLSWTPDGATASDTGISRSAAGVVGVGNGTQGDASGTTKSKLLSPTANPAASGIIALAAADQQCWRNPGNSGDNCLSEDASGALNYAGTPVAGVFTSVNVTPVTANTNTAADQNGMFITVTAGALNSVKRTLLVQLAGVYSTPAASTSVITDKLKLCTVSGCGSGTVVTLATWTTTALGGIQATNDPFNCVLNATTQTAGASAAFEAHGNLTIDLAALATAAESVFADGNTVPVGTIDSTAQLFLQHTKAFSNASASNSFTDRQIIADTVD